tara:strand:- start:855 stop:1292 length:438 start_codon:yes stop_codon:yes gene_type:complete
MKVTRDNKSIIFFDGECVLCNRYILFVSYNDKKDNFRFMSLQNKEIDKLINLRHEIKGHGDSILLMEGKIIKSKSAAVLSILSQLNFPYNLLSFFYIIPKPVRDTLYDLIAKYRYKIYGRTEQCAIIDKHSNAEIVKDKIINNYY